MTRPRCPVFHSLWTTSPPDAPPPYRPAVNLQLTVHNAMSRAQADVLVTAADHAPAAPLLAALRSACGAPPAAVTRVGDRRLPADGLVADCALSSGDVVVVGDEPPATSAVVDVVVHSGAAAGSRFELAPGEHVIGRDPAAAVPVADAMISWHHLRLDVTTDDVTATDLGTTNGTVIEGSAATIERRPFAALPLNLRLGDTALSIGNHARWTVASATPSRAARR